jgi:hypothetical protein
MNLTELVLFGFLGGASQSSGPSTPLPPIVVTASYDPTDISAASYDLTTIAAASYDPDDLFLPVQASYPVAQPIEIQAYRGQDKVFQFQLLTPPSGGVAAWTMLFTLKFTDKDASPILTKSIGSGISIVDSVAGWWNVTLTASDLTISQLINNISTPFTGDLRCDLWRTDSGFTVPVAVGKFTLLSDPKVGT